MILGMGSDLIDIRRIEKTLERYDPLMAAHNMISGRAIECGGIYLLTGDYCPLCELATATSSSCFGLDGMRSNRATPPMGRSVISAVPIPYRRAVRAWPYS